ncbi:hypothetical protein ACJ41O_003718 [Fusarium nematophilum]
MSSTVSAPATATTACTNLYDTPNQDATCAMPFKDSYIDIMKACCGDAKVVSYYNDCGLYCVALDQTVADLEKCLLGKEPLPQDVFCSGKNTSSLTSDPAVPATAQATVISGGDDDDDDSSKDDDKDSNDDDDSETSGTSTGTAAASTGTNTDNAAPGVVPQSSVSTLGLAIGALLFSSMALGAFQI